MKRLTLLILITFLFSSFLFTQNRIKKEISKPMNTDFIHWYGQSAFRIEDGKKQIYIDPFKLPASIEYKADIILITHSHMDHYSPDDIERIRKPETIFIVPFDLAPKLKGIVMTVKPDTILHVDKIDITTVPAYNLNKKFHPKSNEWVGYIIHLENGLTIYHAGDTDAIPEMKKIKTDIALIPVGGTYTMTAEEAAVIINIMHPKIAVPMHYGGIVGTHKDAETFKRLVKSPVIIKSQEK